MHLPPPIRNQLQAAEIIQHRHATGGKHFDPLLGKGFVAVRQVADNAG